MKEGNVLTTHSTHFIYDYMKEGNVLFKDILNTHGAMGCQINPSWGGPIELFLVPASDPRLVYQRLWYVSSCL